MSRPLIVLGVCVAATPVVIYLTAAATAVWFERWYLPRSSVDANREP